MAQIDNGCNSFGEGGGDNGKAVTVIDGGFGGDSGGGW